MAIIGTFQKTKTGYTGTIEMLAIKAEVALTKLNAEGKNTPDYRLATTGDYELGKGWINKSKKSGKDYVRVGIDDPMFPKTVFANLIKTDDGYNLMWSRPKFKKKEQQQTED